MIKPDGIRDAAAREAEAHPVNRQGNLITAWDRRKETLLQTVAEVNRLRAELDALKGALSSRPF